MERAVRMDVMLHAYMFMQSGIPVLYSGDEIGQVNDNSYKENPLKAPDSRYIHRGAMNWELAENISDPDTMEEAFREAGSAGANPEAGESVRIQCGCLDSGDLGQFRALHRQVL